MNQLPANFEQFADARRQGFLTMKGLKDSGKKVVGVFCTYSPVEVAIAAGAIPVGLCSFSDETIPEAEKVLPKNLCPLIKSSYGFAVTDKCPYMYFSDLIVGETTCDGKKKMYELLGDVKNVHVLQLPHTQQDEMARSMWKAEVQRFRERVERDFGVTITDEDLSRAIRVKNEERKLLKELYELSKLTPPPMTGLEQLKLLFGAQFKFDLEEKNRDLRKLIDGIKADYESGTRKVPASAKRILITGCPLSGATEKIVTAIEEAGGVVVCYENCIGAKAVGRLIDTDRDPVEAIADRYLDIGCSVMSPDDNRYAFLRELAEEFKVDGVVEMTLQACHTYAIETHHIRNLMKDLGVPFITVETDYSSADVGQLKTRLGAFIEMLG